MIPSRSLRWLFLVALIFALMPSARAGDIEKKWRVSFAVGGFNALDEVESDATNTLVIRNPSDFDFIDFYSDPRDDSSAVGNLDLQAAPIATVSVQYGITKTFVLEGSVGYSRADLGDVDLSVQFAGLAPITNEVPFRFLSFRVPVGEVERVPIRLAGLARLRPRAKFNPYVGVGIGYSIVGFETDPAFDQLSINMDSSQGSQQAVSSSFLSFPGLLNVGSPVDLEGARVDATDTFEWHLAGGAEISVRSNWSLFVDLRWADASRDISIGFNGGESLGFSVPDQEVLRGSVLDPQSGFGAVYGPVRIAQGGLIDGGGLELQPSQGQNPDTDCVATPQRCTLVFVPGLDDGGQLDPGSYYVQGGNVSYDGLSMQIGFRYTFD